MIVRSEPITIGGVTRGERAGPTVDPDLCASLLAAAYRKNDKDRLEEFEKAGAVGVTSLALGMSQAYAMTIKGRRHRVIPGTNDGVAEWLLTDFNIGHAAGHNGVYHAGAYRYLLDVVTWGKASGLPDPDVTSGHSLGAMVAGAGACELGWPALCFATPRFAVGDEEVMHPDAPCALVQRVDDWICSVPPRFLGFRHAGEVIALTPAKRHVGEDHRLPHYRALMGEQRPGWYAYVEPDAA